LLRDIALTLAAAAPVAGDRDPGVTGTGVACSLVLRLRDGVVLAVTAERHGTTQLQWAIELQVSVDVLGAVGALCYPALVGEAAPGDAVTLNTMAIELGLGTGGQALVVHVAGRSPRPDGDAGTRRVVKARYTPHQVSVQGVDDSGSPHRAAIARAARDGLCGMPVVAADLHSALPAVVAGVHADAPALRVAYLMTDGGSLPLAYSRTVAELGERLCGTVTAGQAYGGDLEAVTVHSGLLACRAVLEADVVVAAPGPGSTGTGTTWGFSGVAAGEVLNAAAVLEGRPVACLRVSGVDARHRHHGVSHHSLTAYGRVALVTADVAVPTGLPGALDRIVAAGVAPLRERHRLVAVNTGGLAAALAAIDAELTGGLRTMGRGFTEDPAPFLTAAAAGRHAAGLTDVSTPGPSPST